MRGERFWKGVVVFCIAFGASTFLSDSYVQKIQTGKNTETIIKSNLKNCVFADSNLKYQTLPLKDNEKGIAVPLQQNVQLIEAEKSQSKSKIEDKKEEKVIPLNAPKKPEIPADVPTSPTNNIEEYQTLLHKEKCQVSDNQK